MSRYSGVIARCQAAIRKGGLIATFYNTGGAQPAHSPSTGTMTGAAVPTNSTPKAIRVKFTPSRFEGQNLVVTNPIQLMVEPLAGFTPAVGMRFDWKGGKYTVAAKDFVGPADEIAYWIIVGGVA